MEKAFKINTEIGPKPELQWVPVEKIIVDSNYQREIVPYRAKKILKNFQWRYFQPVTLAAHPDGTYSVYDGQHRVKAAELHPLVKEVPAMVVTLGSSQEEADAFVVVNRDRTSISPIDAYWAGLHAENPEMLRIKRVLDRAGCEIVSAYGDKAINKTSAVTAVSRSIKFYGDEAVRRALQMIRRVWPNQVGALRGVWIRALAHMYRDYALDDDRLAAALSRQSMFEITASAEAIKKISGGSAEKTIREIIITAYNRGKNKGALKKGGK